MTRLAVLRAWHAVLALAVAIAMALQLWVTVQVPSRPRAAAVGTLAGTALPGRLLRVVSFFTIQSNLLCGAVALLLALAPLRDGPGWRVARLDAQFGITVTGVVYATILAAVHEPHGWKETVSNTLLHYVVPVGAVVGWLLFGPRPRIAARTVLLALIWPVAWFAYTLVHGAVSGWYPYPFVDVATHGYLRVVVNAVLVTLVFAAVAALYLLGDRRLPAAPAQAEVSARTTRDGLGLPS